jgi:hypothetical protein
MFLPVKVILVMFEVRAYSSQPMTELQDFIALTMENSMRSPKSMKFTFIPMVISNPTRKEVYCGAMMEKCLGKVAGLG